MALKLKKPDLMSVFEHQGDTLFEGLDTLVRNGLIYKHQSEAVKAIRRDLHTPTEGDYSNVSLVVGSGKTGVGVMAAYVCKARRVLVVTPSVAISKQQLTQFNVERDSNLNPLNNEPFLYEREVFPSSQEDHDYLLPRSVCVLKKKELENALYNKYELVVTNAHKFVW